MQFCPLKNLIYLKDWVLHPRKLRLAREGGWLLIGQACSFAASLFSVRILTNYLDPNQYGDLALGLTIATLINQLVFGGLGNGIARFFTIAAEKNKLSDYFYASYQIIIKAVLITASIGLIFLIGIYEFYSSYWALIALTVLIYSFLNGLTSIISSIQNAARHRVAVVFSNGLDAWLKILLAVGCIVYINNSAASVIFGYVGSAALVLYVQLYIFKKSFIVKFKDIGNSKKWNNNILNYSRPFLLWGGITWIQLSSDRWALAWFSGSNEVGLYVVLYQIGYAPISLGFALLMSFIAPIFYARAGDGKDQIRNSSVQKLTIKLLMVLMLLTGAGFIFALMFNQEIFGLFLSQKFRSAAHLLPWMLLSGGMFAGGQLMSLQLMSDMRLGLMTKVKIVTALLGCGFNVVGAYFYGMLGVVVALVGFSLTYVIWMAVITYQVDFKKVIKENKC